MYCNLLVNITFQNDGYCVTADCKFGEIVLCSLNSQVSSNRLICWAATFKTAANIDLSAS